MSERNGIRVAVAGLGFGAEFAPIYRHHPDVERVAICDANPDRLNWVSNRYGIDWTFNKIEDAIACDEIDAIHLVSGIPDHARQAIAALEAGKHCASTVPAATSLDELRRLVAAERSSGKRYMMMETAVYTRPFLYAKELKERGDFGRIQFLRGAHYQDMEGWPPYWAGLPPMWYSTHAVGPLLAMADAGALKVHCFGSGIMREELHRQYGNPFPVETAIFQLDRPALSAEVTRSLFQCSRPYMESFTVYGEDACYEWQMENEDPLLFRSEPAPVGTIRPVSIERPAPPDRADQLPPSVGRFTRRFVYGEGESHLSFEQGGGHHGSHPHLVHEFVRAIVEDRPAAIDSVKAANWTAAGICAHESAMNHGEGVEIPAFD